MAGIIEYFQNARGLADFIKAGLPWRWQVVVSNWLIWSIIFFAASLVLLAMHYGSREKPKVAWDFLRTGNPLSIGGERSAEGVSKYYVVGIGLSGENVSGHALHQVDGEITLHRDNRKLPLFVMAAGGIVASNEIDGVPPRAILTLGGQFRNDTPHWPSFEKQMTPEQFLTEFGGFTVDISLDGKRQSWSFTIDYLRETIDEFKREEEERWVTNLMNRPIVKKRAP